MSADASTMARAAEADIRHGGAINDRMARALLREVVRRDFPSLRAAARAWNVSAAHLSNAIRGKSTLGPKLLRPLGIEKHVTVLYRASRW